MEARLVTQLSTRNEKLTGTHPTSDLRNVFAILELSFDMDTHLQASGHIELPFAASFKVTTDNGASTLLEEKNEVTGAHYFDVKRFSQNSSSHFVVSITSTHGTSLQSGLPTVEVYV